LQLRLANLRREVEWHSGPINALARNQLTAGRLANAPPPEQACLYQMSIQALFDMLDVTFPRLGCDHTLRLTLAWLEQQGIPAEPVISWLHNNGGHCDCEALANAEQAWREAISDVDW
jgi:hypothetical protein